MHVVQLVRVAYDREVTPEATRKLVDEMCRNAWALSALTVAANRGLLVRLEEGPATIDELATAGRIDHSVAHGIADVLVALGLASKIEDRVAIDEGLRAWLGASGPSCGDDLLATLGSLLAPARSSAEPEARVGGWTADDRLLVRAQGRVSHAGSQRIRPMLDRIPGLTERLSRGGASLLDVGAGAAGLSVAFATMFPELRVVGIEPSPTALAEARSVVAAARMGNRIALRQQLGEDLDDDGLHSAAWVAQMFVPDEVIEKLWKATLRALELGGFLITGAVAQEGDDFFAAVSRWRNAAWGGGVRTAATVVAQLEAAGFVDIAIIEVPPGTGMTPIVARRPTP